MATRTQRGNVWFVVMLVLLIGGGFLVIGYWQSYDIKCRTEREWSWSQKPPQFVCRAF
jgi:hypothetical protein